MSGDPSWISLARRGGQAPRDDEALVFTQDGAFTARRTVGSARIGAFEGRLAPAAAARLQRLVDALADVGDLTLPTPAHGATETLDVAGRRLELGSNETPPKPWRALLQRLRSTLQDEVVDSPLAAVELVADQHSARLVHAGTDPLDIDLGSVAIRVIRLADDGSVRSRWARRLSEGVDDGESRASVHAWVTARPGWSSSLPFGPIVQRVGPTVEGSPGEWLQVWVEIAIRSGDAVRNGRLYRPVAMDD